jgi:hypothetical protein
VDQRITKLNICSPGVPPSATLGRTGASHEHEELESMNYGQLIREAWAITWRSRFLWVLGLLAGGAVGMPALRGSGTNWRPSRGELGNLPPDLARLAGDVEAWALANLGLVIGAAVVVVLLGLAVLALSFVAQGGLTRATADLAEGRPTSLGQAWRAGRRLFWRYVGLAALLALAALVLAAVIGGVVALSFGVGAAFGARLVTLALAIIFGVPLVLAAAVGAVGVSIVVAYAQRAIAIDNVGPLDALAIGWRVLRGHLGESLLGWVINLGIALAAGTTLALGVGLAVAILGGLGALLWWLAGVSAALVGYAAVAALAVLGLGLVLAAISNTFFWSYWTLLYLRLTHAAGAEPAAA